MKLFLILTLIVITAIISPNGHSTQVIRPTDGFVFERTDKSEARYVVGTGNIWIDADCAIQLGGATQFGTWSDLNAIAPNFDSIAYPCSDTTEASSNQGYVFSRTDKNELRYVMGNSNIWIDTACAVQLGGATQFGTWSDLNAVSPNFDSLAYPCDETSGQSSNRELVFIRTDKDEFRYVLGEDNIWIDIECAVYLTVDSYEFGTWADLNAIAPNFDSISSPCIGVTRPSLLEGYVFIRTDVDEIRYVMGTGNILIDSECANSLNVNIEYGTWSDLNDVAPNFDSISNPCTGLLANNQHDANGDGVVDILDGDFNGDGAVDTFDLDFNGDGFVDASDDFNGDGFNDFLDFDINGDGFTDSLDDLNGDGLINFSDVMADTIGSSTTGAFSIRF